MPSSPVYEFHDIHAGNFAEAAKFLDGFGEGIEWNLMIIPFCPCEERPALEAFKAQLRAWKSKGYALHIHGYMHRAQAGFDRSIFGRLALRLTGGEAEFAGLGRAGSAELLGEALRAWQELDAGAPSGFAAPAWYAPRHLFSQCRELGFESYGSRFAIWGKDKGWRLSVPFSAAGIPKLSRPLVMALEKAYLRIYSVLGFLPVPRIVRHPEYICSL